MWLLFLVVCGIVSSNALPGAKTTITQNGLTYFNSVGMGILQQQIAGLQVPSQSGTVNTGILGNINWSLTNLQISTFQIGTSTIQLIPNTGFQISISNVNCNLGLSWAYQQVDWPNIADSGTANIYITGLSTTVEISVGQANGLPVFKTVADSVNIGNLNIVLHGGASWLYDLFLNVFSQQITQAVDLALQSAISSNIDNGLNQAVSSLPIMEPINPSIEIDYALVDEPRFTGTYTTADQKGEFYAISSPSECPTSVCVAKVTPDSLTDDMMQFFLTDYLANSAGYVLFKLNQLEMTVTPAQVPAIFPLKLNTTDFQTLIPALYKRWPNLGMELVMSATAAPNTQFTSSGSSSFQEGKILVNVILKDNSQVEAFVLAGNLSASAEVSLVNEAIDIKFESAKLAFELQSSNIGGFDVGVLTKYVDQMFSTVIIPEINQIVSDLPLPTVKGLVFSGSRLNWGNGYLCVSTDVTYNP